MNTSIDPISAQVEIFDRQLQQAFKAAGIGIHGRIGRGLPEGDSQLFYSVSGFGQRAAKGSLGERYIGGINIGLALYVPDPRHNDEAIRTAEMTVNRLEWTVETALPVILKEMWESWDDLFTYRDSSRPMSPPHLRGWRLSQMYIRIEVK